MEDNTISFEDFESAFTGEDYHIDTETDETSTGDSVDTETEDSSEGADAPENKENSEGENAQESEEDGAEGEEKPDEGNSEQTFTLKIDGEVREGVSLKEMTELAQKGGAFDRVKGQLDEARQKIQSMEAEFNGKSKALKTLEMIAQKANMPLEDTAKQLRKNFMTSQGKTDEEADALIRAEDAEDALKAASAQKTAEQANKERADREIAEFREHFPGVELTRELCEKLMGDVSSGMSLTNAYLKMENARQAAEIAEMQRKLAAEKQNAKNKKSSPGSQKDSGGRHAKSDYDDFMSAFS